jgi:hypothetical protein
MARKFELVSLVAANLLVLFVLMRLENPSPAIITSINAAAGGLMIKISVINMPMLQLRKKKAAKTGYYYPTVAVWFGPGSMILIPTSHSFRAATVKERDH